jgi:hypothetical protein
VENRLYAEKKRSWNQALIENIFAQEIVQKDLLAGLSSFVHAFYFPVTSLSEILERFSKDDATSKTTRRQRRRDVKDDVGENCVKMA